MDAGSKRAVRSARVMRAAALGLGKLGSNDAQSHGQRKIPLQIGKARQHGAHSLSGSKFVFWFWEVLNSLYRPKRALGGNVTAGVRFPEFGPKTAENRRELPL